MSNKIVYVRTEHVVPIKTLFEVLKDILQDTVIEFYQDPNKNKNKKIKNDDDLDEKKSKVKSKKNKKTKDETDESDEETSKVKSKKEKDKKNNVVKKNIQLLSLFRY